MLISARCTSSCNGSSASKGNDDIAAVTGEHVDILLHVWPGDHVEDNVYPFASSQFAKRLLPVAVLVIDRVVGA